MKNLYLFIAGLLLLAGNAFSQCGISVTFNTQAQIDAFPGNYPGCTSMGAITISGGDITNLDGLSQITSVESLHLLNVSSLSDMSGLNNLTTITNFLRFEGTTPPMMSGLASLTTIGGFFGISGTDLTSLPSFPSLTSIGGSIDIRQNNALTSLTNFGVLTTIGTPNTVSSTITIAFNPSLTTIDGLENLATLYRLQVFSNQNLVSLQGLSGLTNSQYLYVYENAALTSLQGLHNIDPTTLDYLYLRNSPNLITCDLGNICTFLTNGGSYSIGGNGPSCNSSFNIQVACSDNDFPTYGSVSPTVFNGCWNNWANLTINGLVPTSVSTIGYNIDGGTTLFTSVTSDAGGEGTMSLYFSASDDNLVLTIVSVERTDVATETLPISSNNTVLLDLLESTNYYIDADLDGYGDPLTLFMSCTPPEGYVTDNTDCNDSNTDIYQDATMFMDNDGDGYDSGSGVICYGAEAPAGYSFTTSGTDCDDENAAANQSMLLYVDNDGDGCDTGTEIACAGSEAPEGYSLVTSGPDCDDNDASEWQSMNLYIDMDGDGYDNGMAENYCQGTTIPVGYSISTLGADCDDNDDAVWQTADLYFLDTDGDGYHHMFVEDVCYGAELPPNYYLTSLGLDCDDSYDKYYLIFELYIDNDGDYATVGSEFVCAGWDEIPPGYQWFDTGGDCDDFNFFVFQSENVYIDSDGDGYDNGMETICYEGWPNYPAGYSPTTLGSDCDDENAMIHPGAIEIPENGIDENCNGIADDDAILQTTVIKPSQCGSVLAKIYTAIVAVANVPNVTMYTFEVTDENSLVQSISSPVNYFQLTSLADYQFDMTYSVRVGLHVNGIWQGYGTACTVTTPGQNIVIPQCGTTLAQRNSPIFVTGPSFVSSIQIRVTNQSTLASQTITRTEPWFTLKMFPLAGYAYNTAYSVEVRTLTTGTTYSDWTPACTITTPAAAGGKASNASIPVKVVAYPNPYTDTFALNLESSSDANVEVRIYDMVGKLLEVRAVDPVDLEAQRLGNAYPSGVYSVVVTQGSIAETLRVIKR